MRTPENVSTSLLTPYNDSSVTAVLTEGIEIVEHGNGAGEGGVAGPFRPYR